MAKKKTESKEDFVRTRFMGSNNIMLPIEQRVRERLKELVAMGKPEFHKDENGDWHTIEPKTPIAGSLEFGDCVRRINKDEYHINYDLYATDEKGNVVTVPIIAGPGDPGRMHKVIGWRVTEIFKKNLPFITKKQKLEDPEKLRKDYAEKNETYQKLREEKANTRTW